MEKLSIEVVENATKTVSFLPETPFEKVLADCMTDYLEMRKAEEQGLLLRLPCKVGTQIYIINHWWIDEGHICGIAEADDVDCFCYKVYCDPDDYTMVAVEEFNKTWFLTKEEAEQALKQMGE